MNHRNNVIGYKGSPKERLENWITLVELRKSLKYMASIDSLRFKPGIERETNIYKKFFREYLEAA